MKLKCLVLSSHMVGKYAFSTSSYYSVGPELISHQVLISTGKTDWSHDVTWDKGSLAWHLSSATSSGSHKDKESIERRKEGEKKKTEDKPAHGGPIRGIFDADPYKLKRISILNGSHRTVSDDHTKDTVLVFPDWKVLTEIDPSQAGAEALYEHSISPYLPLSAPPPPQNAGSLKSWILPYTCVILLCAQHLRFCLDAPS